MPLQTTIVAGIDADLTGIHALAPQEWNLTRSASKTILASGTAASQADLIFADQRTLTASATEDLDLAGGLTDPFGATLTFVKVKAIEISAAAANTNDVTVSPEATNGFLGPFAALTDQLIIPPGGKVVLTAPVDGWTVTAATGDLLTIANSGAGSSVTYDIVIVGTSA